MRKRWLVVPVLMIVAAILISSYYLILNTGLETNHPEQPAGPAYYVDCTDGDDSNNGTRLDLAWRTLTAANDATLLPGDRLLLKRGCTWVETLEVSWSGTVERPILIGAYGSGNLPRIVSDGTLHYDVTVTGSHVIIEYLYVGTAPPDTNPSCEGNAVGYVVGFKLRAGAAYNIVRYSEATGLYAGVAIDGPPNPAHHNKILNNQIHDNRMMWPLDTSPDNDAGAFGVLLAGDDNEVAYNVISGHDACSYDYERDGAAVEVYKGRRNTIHHNIGIDNNAFTELGHASSEDNVYAYNVARSSLRSSAFLVTRGADDSYGPVRRTKAYNNVAYLTGNDSLGVSCGGGCGPDILVLKNNILWSDRASIYADEQFDEGFNIYWKTGGSPQIWGSFTISQSSILADPRFTNAGLADFRLQSSSPAIDAGTTESVVAGFRLDMAGFEVPDRNGVDIGAFEFNGS